MRVSESVFPRTVWKVFQTLNLGFLLLAYSPESMLVKEGWSRSFREGRAVDKFGAPLPWYTYSSIHFLSTRLVKSMRVFEYGCGNSTLWYANRVKQIIGVEHILSWQQQIQQKLSEPHLIVHKELGRAYVESIHQHGQFDLVVIDGRMRSECAKTAVNALSARGVIIWDNSDRADFAAGWTFLESVGFAEIPFYGVAPNTFAAQRTSILYRRGENCLGI